ncbi:DNA circularization N-terminal domain-containing protein [Ideonella azotifigens]|uniref:DNA circulation N-terminal domain-containing protein n=1 Tax=Ideonella azotifigens TaxID=513160 RepID=A0ABN1K010_9BURK|nr:DNA circularization N-terminal domain-containing protein [Ideonella azotifigens]MCD2344836.1 DNA circularization N-terminal domain-containing protein [Ideonella azotifigens]
MALELAGVVLDKLLSIDVTEGARFVRHAVPGQEGDYAQALGRPSVQIRVRGICYGDGAADDIQTLRGHLLGRAPVDFLCEITGQGYFSQVLVDKLEVGQRAGRLDEFDFSCELTEYLPPPPPPASSPFGDIDTSLLDEAGALMDDVQNALAEVAGLVDLIAGAADFANPTTRLPGMLDAFSGATGGAAGALSAIGELL